ncbi:carcinine transporter-like [Daphnia carinata]|uniref:carcinine transporter-like n=1 Tax=Daphnia carinata TaxID=120202 RepID=UPI002579D222|nr:carcinine transporter-like [Daphnia carinata]
MTDVKMEDKKQWDFDDLLPYVGEFGRYQKLLVWLVCLPACIPCGFHAFNQLFMANVPDHWCKTPPDLEQQNWTLIERKMATIPYTVNQGVMEFSKCTMFNSSEETDGNNITHCLYGWEFDNSTVSSSIVIDFELVCSRSLYPTIGLSLLNVGGIIGVYIFGVISDRVGRKISFFLCLSVELVGGFLTALAPNFWLWAACRFVVGLTIPAIYQIPFIIALELVGPTYRTFITVMTCLFYTLGMLLLSGVAYVVRDWTHLCYATTLPFLVFFIYLVYLPESPRWLMSQGRFAEVKSIMKTCAKINGKEFPEHLLPQLERKMTENRNSSLSRRSAPKEPHKVVGVSSLFRTPNMRLKTILITFNWFANNTVYVGLSYYGPVMGTDEYFSFFLSGLVEIPGYLFCWAVMDRWGRRWPLCMLMVVGGLFCVATVLMPTDAVNETLILYLIAKFAIAASFLILYPFAGELYPTEVRGIGIGFTAYLGGLGLAVIPFVNYLGSEMLVLPLVVMGFISAIGGVVGLRLPETLFKKLPQTMEEGEEFGKDFGMKECLQCIPEKPEESIEMHEIAGQVDNEETPLRVENTTPLSTPLAHRKSMRKILVHRMSSLELPVDKSGLVKLHYWY